MRGLEFTSAHKQGECSPAPPAPACRLQVTLMALMVSHYPLRMDQNMRQATEVARQVVDAK